VHAEDRANFAHSCKNNHACALRNLSGGLTVYSSSSSYLEDSDVKTSIVNYPRGAQLLRLRWESEHSLSFAFVAKERLVDVTYLYLVRHTHTHVNGLLCCLLLPSLTPPTTFVTFFFACILRRKCCPWTTSLGSRYARISLRCAIWRYRKYTPRPQLVDCSIFFTTCTDSSRLWN